MKGDNITLVAAPLRKQVIERLRDAIVSVEYEPGERLVERDLCERFGVSRTVIREALRHLEAEGLIDLVANRGPVVAEISPDEASGFYEVREVLEALAARRCAERATPAQKRKLKQALARVAEAYKQDKPEKRLLAKDTFYQVLCDGTNQPVIGDTLRSINVRVQVLRGLSLRAKGRAVESLAELRAVVAAVVDGDGDQAAELAAAHVRKAAASAMEVLAEQGRQNEVS